MRINQKYHEEIWNNIKVKKEIIKYFKKGHCLGSICRKFHLDISIILYILKTGKIKKNVLYNIYNKQIIQNERREYDIILESDMYYLNKFFPNTDTEFINSSYYHYWKKELNKVEKRKNECKHEFKVIKCSLCGKILKDASNIQI